MGFQNIQLSGLLTLPNLAVSEQLGGTRFGPLGLQRPYPNSWLLHPLHKDMKNIHNIESIVWEFQRRTRTASDNYAAKTFHHLEDTKPVSVKSNK